MAFKHLSSRQVTDAQWDHVESLGVRYSHDGSRFYRGISHMTVDEERGYYLVMRGATQPRGLFEDGSDRKIYFYALCLDNNVFYFDVEQNEAGDLWENSYELYWKITRVELPDGWSFDSLSVEEFKQIVTEAFTAESFNEIFKPERFKDVTVVFPENFGE